MEHRQLASWGLFLLFWALSALDDWRHYKIRNGTVLLGFAGTATLSIFVAPRIGLFPWLLASAWGWIIGIALWQTQVWPAGDAKLFALLCSLMVLLLPSGTYPSVRTFIIQITNTFIPAAIILSAGLIFSSPAMAVPNISIRTRLRNILDPFSFKRRLLPLNLISQQGIRSSLAILLLIIIFGITAWEWCTKHFGFNALPAIVAALWFGSKFLRAFLNRGAYSKWKISAACIIVLAFAYREFAGHYSWALARNILSAFEECLILAGLFCVIDYYLEQFESYPLPIGQLKPGMIISTAFMGQLAKKGFRLESLGKRYPDGLTAPQARLFKYWCRKQGIREAKVYRTHPFAFWMFLGAWLTIILHKDLISLAIFTWRKG